MKIPATSSGSHRWLAPLVLGALLGATLLAGCAPATRTDPLAAASVDGRPITLASYTQVVTVYRILAARQQGVSDWQSPAGRKGLADVQAQALDFLENLEMYREQLARLGLQASSKVIADDEQQLRQNIQDQIKQNPGDSSLTALNDALGGDVISLFAEQDADIRALIASDKVQVPVVHARVLLAKTQADAQSMQTQLEHGADFAALAKTHNDQSVPAGGDFGIVYLGQLTGLPTFDQKVLLDRSASSASAARYVILNDAGSWELFELTQPGTKSISSLADPQTQQTVFSAWVSEVVRPQTKIERYVSI